MKMRRFFREGILLSFVFALVLSSAYAQGLNHAESCSGALESVGRIACDDNALCYQDDGAFTCGCRDTFFGDGWAAGSGCYEGLSHDMPESGRVKRLSTGMWYGRKDIEPCKGFWAFMGRIICVRNSSCMQGFKGSFWIKCLCLSGKGNGISSRFAQGTGCH